MKEEKQGGSPPLFLLRLLQKHCGLLKKHEAWFEKAGKREVRGKKNGREWDCKLQEEEFTRRVIKRKSNPNHPCHMPCSLRLAFAFTSPRARWKFWGAGYLKLKETWYKNRILILNFELIVARVGIGIGNPFILLPRILWCVVLGVFCARFPPRPGGY